MLLLGRELRVFRAPKLFVCARVVELWLFFSGLVLGFSGDFCMVISSLTLPVVYGWVLFAAEKNDFVRIWLPTAKDFFFFFCWLFSILILAREEEWGFVEDGISAVVMENRV